MSVRVTVRVSVGEGMSASVTVTHPCRVEYNVECANEYGGESENSKRISVGWVRG